ncbi:threonine aldolase family protein, partial [bacterium]
NHLQDKVADMLGKEAGLFVASGTMGNQVSINAHTQPGQEVILDSQAHIFYYEAGGPALLSGVQLRPLVGINGALTAEQIEEAIRPDNVHFPPTQLICLENTHNRAGGRIYPIEEIRKIRKVAESHTIQMHLDGARLWNASVATGISMKEYASYFDSVSVCFSKGLGAPIGSLVVGEKSFIQRAHRYRKIYGGGMRQVGILAAAAMYAVENNVQLLSDDHRRARKLAGAVSSLQGFTIDMDSVQTNIVIIDVDAGNTTAQQITDALKKKDVLLLAIGPQKLRVVTHLEVTDDGIDRAIGAFQEIAPK